MFLGSGTGIPRPSGECNITFFVLIFAFTWILGKQAVLAQALGNGHWEWFFLPPCPVLVKPALSPNAKNCGGVTSRIQFVRGFSFFATLKTSLLLSANFRFFRGSAVGHISSSKQKNKKN